MRVYRAKTVATFLKIIDPLNTGWHPGHIVQPFDFQGTAGWVFRGHDSTKYKITPRAFRKDAFEDFIFWNIMMNSADPLFAERHCLMEVTATRNFITAADRYGLTNFLEYDTPKRIGDFIRSINKMISSGVPKNFGFPPRHLMESFALAQHHGIPTRFVDWTRSAYIAAYFAAKTACYDKRNLDQTDHIAVWALNLKTLDINETTSERLRVLTVPNAGNEYLRQQDGLFLYDAEANEHYRKHKKWPNLDFLIKLIWAQKGNAINTVPLIKIELPIPLCEELLQKLYGLGLKPIEVMPTLDNAVETVRYYRKVVRK